MFIICGEALIDIFVDDKTNSEKRSTQLQAYVGGSPFNVAVGLARLDQPVSLLTGLSNDMFGQRLSTVLNSEGVSQDLIVKKQLPTAVAFIENDKHGVPTYTFLGEGTADRSLLAKDVDIQIEVPIAIHLGSYSIVSQPTADSFLSLIKKYQGKCLISLDPNIRAIVEPNMNIWQERVEEIIVLSDIVKVSDEDLSLMYPNTLPEEIIQRWLTTGLKLVVLTRGSDGSTLWSANSKVDLKSPKIKVIDTVGAGDTYQASLLDSIGELYLQYGEKWAGQLNEQKLKEIGAFATSASAITCSRQGADLPTNSEILAFIKTNS